MATVTGLTADRMLAIEAASVIDGDVVGNNLILKTHGGTNIDAGNVRGPTGPSGGAFTICTSTTRPAVTGADEGKAIYETDTDLVRIWTGTRWRLQEKIICTSTTRPAGLVAADEGVKIYETDTNTEYSWTGSAWMPYSNPPIFASAADRNTKWPAPTDGSVSYLSDAQGVLWLYFGGAWHPYGQYVGSLEPTLLANPIDNHCFCYGQVLVGANVNYPTLWAVVDPAWKSGNDLKIPDLRGRVPVGKDDMGGTPANRVTTPQSGINGVLLGAVGGDQRMHAHQHVGRDTGHGHGVNDGGHDHGTGSGLFGSGFVDFGGGGQGTLNRTDRQNANIGIQQSWAQIQIDSAGAGNGQNMPPSIILNWMLKLR